jgi:hypothetical protein
MGEVLLLMGGEHFLRMGRTKFVLNGSHGVVTQQDYNSMEFTEAFAIVSMPGTFGTLKPGSS